LGLNELERVQNNLEYLLEFLHGSAQRLELRTSGLHAIILGYGAGDPAEVNEEMTVIAENIDTLQRVYALVVECLETPGRIGLQSSPASSNSLLEESRCH
jgi:hypothetical protein